jgi:hypothetical protein
MKPARFLLLAAWLGLPASSLASDAMGKKAFLLSRALKNNDCLQARELSTKLIDEFPKEEETNRLQAQTLLQCSTDFPQAWKYFQTYIEMGGDSAKVRDDYEKVLMQVARVDVVLSPKGFQIPTDFDSGVQLTWPTTAAAIRDDARHYRLALMPGTYSIGFAHEKQVFEAITKEASGVAGSSTSMVFEPVTDLTKVTIRVESSLDKSGVTVRAGSAGVYPGKLVGVSDGVFEGYLKSGEIEVRLNSSNILQLPRTVSMNGKPGEEIQKNVPMRTLEAATVSVGTLNRRFKLSVDLPHGKTVLPYSNQTLETGGGEASWAVHLSSPGDGGVTVHEQLTRRFVIPPGSSQLPLPSAVELTVNGAIGHRMLFAHTDQAEEKEFMLDVPGTKGKDSFAVLLQAGAAGEVKGVALHLIDVPAYRAYSDWRGIKKRRGGMLTGAIVTGLVAAVSGGLAHQWRGNAAADLKTSKGLTGAAAQDEYASLRRRAKDSVRMSNIAAGGSIGTSVVSAFFVYRFTGLGSKISTARAAFEAERTKPHAPHSPASDGSE